MKRKIFIIALALFSLSVFAETKSMYVSVRETTLRAKPSNNAKVITKVYYGDIISVTSSDNKWSKVIINETNGTNKEGYILSSTLTRKKIIAKGNRVTADANEIALAGKGFSSEVENEYKKSGNVDYSAVDKVEEAYISEDEQMRFITDGNLNGAE